MALAGRRIFPTATGISSEKLAPGRYQIPTPLLARLRLRRKVKNAHG